MADEQAKANIDLLMRLRFREVDGERFLIQREYVEHFLTAEGPAEHIWVTIRVGSTDAKGKRNLERRMGM